MTGGYDNWCVEKSRLQNQKACTMNESHNGHFIIINSINDPVIPDEQLSVVSARIFRNLSTGLREML